MLSYPKDPLHFFEIDKEFVAEDHSSLQDEDSHRSSLTRRSPNHEDHQNGSGQDTPPTPPRTGIDLDLLPSNLKHFLFFRL